MVRPAQWLTAFRSRWPCAASACCAMALLLSGCASGGTSHVADGRSAIAHDGKDRSDVTVGVVGTVDQSRNAIVPALLSAIDDARLHAVYAASNGDAGGQQRIVDDYVERNVDVVVLFVDRSTGWDDALGRARDAGVPVVLADGSIEPDDTSLYSASLKLVEDDAGDGDIGGILMDVVDGRPHDRVAVVAIPSMTDDG